MAVTARNASKRAAAWAAFLALAVIVGSVVPHLANAEPSGLAASLLTGAVLVCPVLVVLWMSYTRARRRSETVLFGSLLVGAMRSGGILMPLMFLVFTYEEAVDHVTALIAILATFGAALLIHIRLHLALKSQSGIL